jgi:hypothetical protein
MGDRRQMMIWLKRLLGILVLAVYLAMPMSVHACPS